MTIKAVKPEDVLADDKDYVSLNGVQFRKGSIAAFLKNIDLFEDPSSDQAVRLEALEMIKSLSPAIIATGLHKHAIFRNQVIQDILDNL